MKAIRAILSKKSLMLLLSLGLSFFVTTVAADNDDCQDPVRDCQPRQLLKQRLEEQGWVVQRIRIDDGCYEVRALDEQGRKVKATFSPSSLSLLKLEWKKDKHTRSPPTANLFR